MLRHSSPSPAGAAAQPREMWDDDWEEPSEPELDDDAYEFDPDQPAAERRDEIRARGPIRYSPVRRASPPALERPATLAVQRGAGGPGGARAPPVPSAPAEAAAELPAAGMPSGGASATQSAAATPGGRRDSQLTERGYFDVKYYHNKLW